MSESEKDLQIKENDEKDRRNKKFEEKALPTSGNGTPIGELPVQKWPVQQRLVGIFRSPGAAMANIAGAPNYAEPAFLVLLEAILGGIAVGVSMGKMQIIGPYAAAVTSRVNSMLAGTVFLAGLLMFLFWAIRAKIVQFLCKGDSNWQFQSAAAVAGYAMIPGLLTSILSMIIMAAVLPTVVIDTASLALVQQTTANFTAQTQALKVSMTVPLSLIANTWGAYLGGLGVEAGTRGKCSFAAGFAIFFVIGLIDLLLIFV